MKVIFLQTYVNHIEKDQRGSSTSLWAKKNSIVISVYTVTAARIIMISTYAVIAASIGQIRYKTASLHTCKYPREGSGE